MSKNKIISKEGLSIYYWINYHKKLSKNFKILHPGSSMNHNSLQSLEKGLNKKGFPTLILDPRGTGLSKAPSKLEYFSLDSYSDDLKKIIEKEGLEKPSYIGHSFGFMPIIDYISKNSNAKEITGICTSYNFSKTANKFLFHSFDKVLRYLEYFGSAGKKLENFVKNKKRGNQSDLNNKSDFDVWFSIVDAPFKQIKNNILNGIEINKIDITKQLKQIKVPVNLIYGTKDIMVKKTDYIPSLIKCNIRIIEGTHSLPVIQSDKILKIL